MRGPRRAFEPAPGLPPPTMPSLEPLSPPPGGPADARERPRARAVFAVVFDQAWGLCVAYLAVGLLGEVGRRLGLRGAAAVQGFLDGLPFFVLRATGLLEAYLQASAIGRLTPFWNRIALSSLTVLAILVQASVLGLLLAGLWRLSRVGRRAA